MNQSHDNVANPKADRVLEQWHLLGLRAVNSQDLLIQKGARHDSCVLALEKRFRSDLQKSPFDVHSLVGRRFHHLVALDSILN